MTEKLLLSWSGGKDSCVALYEIQETQSYEIAALLTTVTGGYDRISMHGVRRILVEQQAASLGLSLHKVCIPQKATNEEYESRMSQVLAKYRAQGVRSVAFGDLFLEDIRKYRENNLAKIGMKAVFPLWKNNTAELVRKFIELGFKAIVTCADSKVLDRSFVGKVIDEDFLHQLPAHVDPCGENGEFHSFVFTGPIFRDEIRFTVGELVLRDSFWFCDLLAD